MIRKIKTAIFISGYGSNMLELIKASLHHNSLTNIALIISNNKNAYGLTLAKEYNIPTFIVSTKKNNINYENQINDILIKNNIELICLAGFMKILSGNFVNKWKCRIINIHPSLLPKHKGLHTHKRALDSGHVEHGCTVHYVEPDVDSGPIIIQAKLTILPDDTLETLSGRIQVLEHTIYPIAMKRVAANLLEN
jgi:phosphoribosylglycinamide formyltransferase-1